MKFSIIHASYGRPELAFETLEKWRRSSSQRVERIMSFDRSDSKFSEYEHRASMAYMGYAGSPGSDPFHYIINDTNTSVAAINAAAKEAKGDIIIVISDDFEPIKNWDLEILKAVEGKEDWILKTQDGTQPWIITLPIMDRKYYERFGYVYYPAYLHMFCDCEMTHVADLLGHKLTSSLLFKHNHYSIGGIAKDQTSVKADKTWNQGKKVYLDNLMRKFDLGDVDVMKLPPEARGHVKWLHTELLGVNYKK